jgi:hypothetical protein
MSGKRVVVAGLDLSLRGSAAVVLGAGWSPISPWRGGFASLRLTEQGKLEGQERCAAIVHALCAFVVGEGATHVFVEEHSFSKGLMQHAFARAELVGAVKHSLWSIDHLPSQPVVASAARRLLFGPQHRMTSKEWKRFIEARFAEMGAPAMSEDERDAFVVANAGWVQLGCCGFLSPTAQ